MLVYTLDSFKLVTVTKLTNIFFQDMVTKITSFLNANLMRMSLRDLIEDYLLGKID